MDDTFAFGVRGKSVEVAVTYRDAGFSTLGVEYDSQVSAGPLAGAFRPARSVAVTGGRQWKTARFTLPDCGFTGRCNGGDFRLFVTGSDMELAVTGVEVVKPVRTTTSSSFGSGWIHSGPGGRTTTSTPFGNGWIHSR